MSKLDVTCTRIRLRFQNLLLHKNLISYRRHGAPPLHCLTHSTMKQDRTSRWRWSLVCCSAASYPWRWSLVCCWCSIFWFVAWTRIMFINALILGSAYVACCLTVHLHIGIITTRPVTVTPSSPGRAGSVQVFTYSCKYTQCVINMEIVYNILSNFKKYIFQNWGLVKLV